MLAVASPDASGGGWRRSPIVALVAAIVIALGLVRLACTSFRRPQDVELPPHVAREAKGIPRYCPTCKKVFVFTREQLEGIPGDAPLLVKAREAPCPTCHRTGTTEAIACQHCGHYVPVYVGAEGGGARRCPKCGKNPF